VINPQLSPSEITVFAPAKINVICVSSAAGPTGSTISGRSCRRLPSKTRCRSGCVLIDRIFS